MPKGASAYKGKSTTFSTHNDWLLWKLFFYFYFYFYLLFFFLFGTAHSEASGIHSILYHVDVEPPVLKVPTTVLLVAPNHFCRALFECQTCLCLLTKKGRERERERASSWCATLNSPTEGLRFQLYYLNPILCLLM